MTGRWWAKWSILALTLAWLAWELIANFDTDPGTWPLTWLIRHYVSPWIYFPAAVGLAVWLVFHFRPSNDRIDHSSPEGLTMTQPVSSQAVVKRSAAVSAVRTLGQGVIVSVAGAVAAWLPTAFGDVRWTREYWVAWGLSLGGVIVMAATSYIHGRVSPRKVP
jgi:hypothetical protein